MAGFEPLLRSPPFPGIDPAVATITRRGAAAPLDAALIERAAAAITAARVGGHFWSPAEDPWALLDGMAEVPLSADRDLALLALAAGKAVVDDAGRAISADERLRLLHAHLIDGIAYRCPWTGAEIDLFGAVERLAFWRAWVSANRGIAAATGMSWWKRRHIARFLWDGRADALPFPAPRNGLACARRKRGALAIWPSRVPRDTPAQARLQGVPLWRVEDGFIRSAGLGSDLLPPFSIVVDRQGIYFDPTAPSDLETLLATHAFAPDLVARAAALRERVVAAGIGKYGAAAESERLHPSAGRRVVLVAGQVEDDLSVALGGAGVAGNAGLLAAARAAEPDAFLVFRPHPDVEAGHRPGGVPDVEALRYADVVQRGGSLFGLLEQVDAVHVLSSLTGFEALLRGKDVIVHGQPFFAGWGLTRDLGPPLPRRGRNLGLDELVAGALILYPRCLDPITGLPCPPEILLDHLPAAAARRPAILVRARRLQGRLRRSLFKGYVAA